MNRTPLALFAAVPLLAASAAAQITPLPGLRIWSTPESTRLVVQMTGEFGVVADRAPNPERLFFDITGARPSFFTRGEQSVPVGDRIIRRLRIARWQPTVLRIVLDLEQPVEFSISQLSVPDRFIVEVRPAGAAGSSAPLISEAPPVVPPPVLRAQRPRTMPVSAMMRKRTRVLPRPEMLIPPAPRPETLDVTMAPDPTHARERGARAIIPARAARITGRGDVSLTRALGLKIARVVIDAGHGGHDTGTSGPSGLLEKDLVLDLALRLGDLITKRLGAEVIYTRSDDTFIGLRDRTLLANDRRADLFLSIHANSSPADSASGVETFFLNFTSDQYSLQVAARENATSENSLYDLPNLVQQIAKHDKRDESRQFASRMQSAMYSFAARGNVRAKDRGIKSAPFVVLIGARMPSVLCEVGFLTNARDEAMLRRSEHRQKLAEALYRGLSGYASTLSHVQVAVNQ